MVEQFDVLIFGSSIIDFICYVSRLPKIGETIQGHEFSNGYGGKGANQCVAAAKLGARTAIITKLGDDLWGKNYLENFKKFGVNTDFVELIKNEATGIAQITVDDKGYNNIVVVTGANKRLSINDVECASQLFENSKVLLCQLETPLNANIAAIKAFKGISILNAAPALENLPHDLIKLPTIFCVNEVEAAIVTGMDTITLNNVEDAVSTLIKIGANTVIITLGEYGAVYSTVDERKTVHVKSVKVDKVVDTSGAGDAFLGALAYYLAKYPNLKFHQKVGAACKIAAISVQSPGTQKSFPTQSDVTENFIETEKFEWNYV